MKMAKYILSVAIAFLLLMSCNTTKSAIGTFSCELINSPIIFFKIDVFGNIYTVDPSNKLKVYDPTLNLLFEYYNNGLGDITYIDITNPRKIILFFSGFQKMVFLDNTLSEIGRYESDFNLPFDIRAIGSSRDNNIWIYDALDYRLKKIDAKGRPILSTNPLQTHLDIDVIPDYIIEYNNEVLLIEEDKGVIVFDNLGNYLRYIRLDGAFSISVKENKLLYVKESFFYSKSLNNVFEETVQIQELSTNTKVAYLFKENLLFVQDNCLKKMKTLK